MKTAKPSGSKISPVWLSCLLLLVILGALFWKCFLPDYIHFSNDGALGMQHSACLHLPETFLGQWIDITSIGVSSGAALADLDSAFRWGFGSVGLAKFYIPLALFLLGWGAAFFFRRSGMGMAACVLGALAAALTTNFFSDSCWGASPAVAAFAMDFFALGALAKKDKLPFWVAPALAGLAVGVNVTEAADIGGLFSVLVAAYVIYKAAAENGSPLLNRTAAGVGRVLVVGVFAFFMAAYGILGFIGTSVQGISGTQQDVQTKAAKWDFATQWSLPKRETLSLIIPGLFGDRVDFGDERAYWGGMGRDASWDRFYHEKLQPGDTVTLTVPGADRAARFQINNNGDLALPSIAPIKAAGMTRNELQSEFSSTPLKGAAIQYVPAGAFQRHTGRGFYFGLLVVILGLWAAFQSFRKQESVFSLPERKMIWFWSAVALISLLAAHGKFSPLRGFYYWIYTILPYSSTVRSPEKFLHVMNLAMIVLFAYGVQGLDRRYFQSEPTTPRLKNWWLRAAAFDKRWVVGSVFAIILAAVGWVMYAASRPAVEKYLGEVQFGPNIAHAITGYSLHQVGWFVVFLVLDCFLLLMIFAGAFAGKRAVWGGVLLGALLVWDLGRADMQFSNPWKDQWDYGFWNYKVKYEVDELNPICKVLADKPYEHRVQMLQIPDEAGWFSQLYDIEWNQQIFPFYNIQSMDIAQLPRYPADLEAFELAQAFPGTPPWTRHWQLTNTRYLVGPAINVDEMNQQLDPVLKRFRILSVFRLAGKPGVDSPRVLPELTALPLQPGDPELNDNRVPKYALYEFTGALPRVKLYSNWEAISPAALSSFTTNGLDFNQHRILQSIGTNDFLTLKKLMSPSFDPSSTVLVDRPIAGSTTSSATNKAAGDVDFASYSPNDIKLKANATAPSVLLLNDRYDPKWQVFVDGKPAELLRCNYIMRGVFLQPGQHEVDFRYRQPVKLLYVNIAAVVVGLGLLGYAIAGTRKQSEIDEDTVKPDSEKAEKLNAPR